MKLELDSSFMAADSTSPLEARADRPLRKTERTRLRLVDAVRAEIEATGGFTAEHVARRAETSPATFYNHFESKDDLIVAVKKTARRMGNAILREASASKGGIRSEGNAASYVRCTARLVQLARLPWVHVHNCLLRIPQPK